MKAKAKTVAKPAAGTDKPKAPSAKTAAAPKPKAATVPARTSAKPAAKTADQGCGWKDGAHGKTRHRQASGEVGADRTNAEAGAGSGQEIAEGAHGTCRRTA